MVPGKSILERAFEMANSGRFNTTIEIQKALQREGYNGRFVKVRTLLRQLRGIMGAARGMQSLAQGTRLEHEMPALPGIEYIVARRPLLSEMDAEIMRARGFRFRVFDAARGKFELETHFTVSPGPSPHTWTFRQDDVSGSHPAANPRIS